MPGGTPCVNKGAGLATARQWLSSNRIVRGKDIAQVPAFGGAGSAASVFYSVAVPGMLTDVGADSQGGLVTVGTLPIPSGSENAWMSNLFLLLVIPALIALNGLFVAAEFALVAIRKTRVEEMVLKGVKGAKAVEAAL